jgi:ribonuclease HII
MVKENATAARYSCISITDAEKKRLSGLLKYERKARSEGFKDIAGVDEAGRGPLAGPVVACACILPKGVRFPLINDSKQLTALQREKLFQSLTTTPGVRFGIGMIDHTIIDLINILQASIQAMLSAISQITQPEPDLLLVDGMAIPHPHIPCWKIVKGDAKSQSIAAASILAKVTRDRLMDAFHEAYPEYDFKNNKGYGTPAHLEALKKFGPCPIHRLTFEPIAAKELAEGQPKVQIQGIA